MLTQESQYGAAGTCGVQQTHAVHVFPRSVLAPYIYLISVGRSAPPGSWRSEFIASYPPSQEHPHRPSHHFLRREEEAMTLPLLYMLYKFNKDDKPASPRGAGGRQGIVGHPEGGVCVGGLGSVKQAHSQTHTTKTLRAASWSLKQRVGRPAAGLTTSHLCNESHKQSIRRTPRSVVVCCCSMLL